MFDTKIYQQNVVSPKKLTEATIVDAWDIFCFSRMLYVTLFHLNLEVKLIQYITCTEATYLLSKCD